MPADEAIVLVGGLGTRLRPVVQDVPKPLAPVAGRPFLAWVMDGLADNGIRRVVLATGHMAELVEDAIGTRWLDMQVDYSVESEPLGTAGAVRRACRILHGAAVHVLNGDTFLQYSPLQLERSTIERACHIGMALADVPEVARYGAVECTRRRVTGFREKGVTGAGLINAGAYFLTPEAVAMLPATVPSSFEQDVLVPAVASGVVCGYRETRGFIDIGIPEDFHRAQTLFTP